MDPLAGIDPIALWRDFEPVVGSLAARSGVDLVRAGAAKLWERIRDDPAPAQQRAELNARNYTSAFGAVLEGLRTRGELTDDDLARAIASPAIARVLERAILTASLTGEPATHRRLAQLVAARLQTTDESTLSLLLRDGCERIEFLNLGHLRSLAVMYFIKWEDAPPTEPTALADEQLEQVLAWVKPRSHALGEPTCSYSDVNYLDGLHLLKFRAGARTRAFGDAGYDFSRLHQRVTTLVYPGRHISKYFDVYQWIVTATTGLPGSSDHPSAGQVSLTYLGALLGYATYCDLIGEQPDFAAFSGEYRGRR